MNGRQWWTTAGVCAVLVLAGCGQPEGGGPRPAAGNPNGRETRPGAGQVQDPGPQSAATIHVEGRVAGPYVHKNLTVFLIDSPEQDGRDFLTLDEGLTKGLVKVSETDAGQVGELRIDNRSDRPLYLQEGERLQGGKQDRTIIASMVVPPRSGWTPIRAFCVEHNRWTAGARGQEFGFVANAALAPKGVRGEAKIDGSQQGVWDCVSAQKATAFASYDAASSTSSLNEMLDSPAVQKISDEYADALADPPVQDSGAVGVVVALNGQLEEADVYPNHEVLRKLYPRLIRSYAVQAEMLKDLVKNAKALSVADVGQLLRDGAARSQREEKVDARNTLQVRALEGNRYQCVTEYEGKVVHWQVMRKNGAGDRARGHMLGSDW